MANIDNQTECQLCSYIVSNDCKNSRRFIAARCGSSEKCVNSICNHCADAIHKITHNTICGECNHYTNFSGEPKCPYCNGLLKEVNGYEFVKPVEIQPYPDNLPSILRRVWNQCNLDNNIDNTLTILNICLFIKYFS